MQSGLRIDQSSILGLSVGMSDQFDSVAKTHSISTELLNNRGFKGVDFDAFNSRLNKHMKKIYWIDCTSGEVKSGVKVEESMVVYSADFDGKDFTNESHNHYMEWTVKGNDGKMYCLLEDDLYYEKPKL